MKGHHVVAGLALDFLDDPAVIKEPDAVGAVGGAEQVVRDHQYSRAALFELFNQRSEVGRGARVEPRGRLVEKQHGDRTNDGHSNRNLLAHTLRKPAERLIAGFAMQSGGIECGFARIGSVDFAGQGEEIVDVLARREMFVERDILGQIGEAATRTGSVARRIDAVNAKPAS